jgi:hypothetical protein
MLEKLKEVLFVKREKIVLFFNSFVLKILFFSDAIQLFLQCLSHRRRNAH